MYLYIHIHIYIYIYKHICTCLYVFINAQFERNQKEIYTNLKRANITFKDFNFDIDRIIIDSTEGVSQNQYLVFHNYSYNV